MNKMFEQFQLNKEQMNLIEGGISAEEYCETLHTIIKNNELTPSEEDGAAFGWRQAGCGNFYNDVVF